MSAGTLLPDRHPQGDFVVCDLFAASPKGDLATMEHPIFSLATRPDRRVLRYTHKDTEIEITPSVKGLATLHDKDILIYCISQLVAALNAGRQVSRTLHLKAYDLLVATNRETSGDGYKRLRDAFERLAGTRIVTNIETGGIEVTSGFGLIEAWEIRRRTKKGRMISVSVTLSEWLYRAVLSRSVLTLSPDYFRLRKPLERRIYEIVRKHCGNQPRFRISLVRLKEKCGSTSALRVFRKMVRDVVAEDHLPGYRLSFEDDMLEARPKGEGRALPPLGEADYEAARAVAPGWDIYALEADWRAMWAAKGRPRVTSPAKAFLGYCKARTEGRGPAA